MSPRPLHTSRGQSGLVLTVAGLALASTAVLSGAAAADDLDPRVWQEVVAWADMGELDLLQPFIGETK